MLTVHDIVNKLVPVLEESENFREVSRDVDRLREMLLAKEAQCRLLKENQVCISSNSVELNLFLIEFDSIKFNFMN